MVEAKIHTLLTVISTGSFTEAAKMLSLTQPAVSNHIRQLEQSYGIKIFYKSKKKLLLTPEGAVLEKYARRAVAVAAAARQAILDRQKNIRHLSVAITPTVGEHLVPQVMAAYCGRHQDVHMHIQTAGLKDIHDLLRTFEVDLAVIEGELSDDSLISVLLDTDYLCLIAPADHPFAGRASVRLEELQGERFILRSKGAGTRKLFESYLLGNFHTIQDYNVMIEMDNVATIKELVEQGLGVSVIGHSACIQEQRKGKLAVLPIENASMVRKVNMVYRIDFAHPEVAEELRELYNGYVV